MGNQIDIEFYVKEIKEKMNLSISDELIKKDLLLTLILAEFEKLGLGKELILKGGTLLARNYLKYHRLSEDLDFVHKDSNNLRLMPRKARERKIKAFIDIFTPKLKEVADALDLGFSENRSDQKYCSILHGRTVYTFRLYYEEGRYIKVEINFVEKILNKPIELSVRAITDFFDSKELMFILGLKIDNFRVLSYPIEEIILEKYRAILTRKYLKERDLFDLYLIPNSLEINIGQVAEKILASSLIKRELSKTLPEKLSLLNKGEFFLSDERISDLAVVNYDAEEFEKFKEKIKPVLIKICELTLKKI